MGKCKVSASEKLHAIHMFLNGIVSKAEIARSLGVSKSTVQQWICNYESIGEEAFIMTGYKKYDSELKESAINDYLSGRYSQSEICLKYGIRSRSKLQQWILKYNNHEELNSSKAGGTTIMIKGRKTTFNERINIIEYCIENDKNYIKTAEKYNVSYNQVYSWVKKYESKGLDGLLDKRGHAKPEGEMSEVEKLKAENRLLRAENRRKEIEVALLKKLEEIERRRY